MADIYTPTAVANEALDAAALDFTLGDIADGTRPAQVCLRAYTRCFKQLIRAAHWSFARKEAPLQLVADASGLTAGVGTLVPAGFIYAYNYPSDCALVRYIPAANWNVNPPVPAGNITPSDPTAPLTTGQSAAPSPGWRPRPTRFLVTNDPNYVPDGASNDIPGVSPIGQTLILSNVQNARCVYTFEATWVNLWDEMFRSAMVAFMASQIVLPLARDKKFGAEMRNQNIAIAKDKIRDARAMSSNEGWSSSDIGVDWMRIRMGGGPIGYWGNNWGAGAGYLVGGFGGLYFGDNASAY